MPPLDPKEAVLAQPIDEVEGREEELPQAKELVDEDGAVYETGGAEIWLVEAEEEEVLAHAEEDAELFPVGDGGKELG